MINCGCGNYKDCFVLPKIWTTTYSFPRNISLLMSFYLACCSGCLCKLLDLHLYWYATWMHINLLKRNWVALFLYIYVYIYCKSLPRVAFIFFKFFEGNSQILHGSLILPWQCCFIYSVAHADCSVCLYLISQCEGF